LINAPSYELDVTGLGPCAAIAALQRDLPLDEVGRKRWLQQAKVAAILGSCPKTRDSLRSGFNSWIKFATAALGGRKMALPPTLEGMLAWSLTFRCVGTFSNYSGHVRTVCLALDVAAPAAGHPGLRRAKVAIVKRMLFTPRPRMFLQRTTVRNLVLAVDRGMETQSFAMLWLATYCFLLRLPSEALMMRRGGEGFIAAGKEQSVLHLDPNGELVLTLNTRKNKIRGSTLRRSCSCAACKRTCPVHALWFGFFAGLAPGAQPWACFTAAIARCHLRSTLTALGFGSPGNYGTHDFRRGHAKDMQQAGATMEAILAAGEWRSRAVFTYLDHAELERDDALEAAMHSDTDNEEWID